MGTNFYFTDGNQISKHIGKRSAAGSFCWDCHLSLCVSGNRAVHEDSTWSESCLVCGSERQKEDLVTSAPGRELGFNKGPFEKKVGVASCSSFNWAMSPGLFSDYKAAPNLHIEDEYGRLVENFSDILKECPIQFFDMIGCEFS